MEITAYLTQCIRSQTAVSFSKYGDGEYLAARGSEGSNCDRDTYTEALSIGIKDAFSYMVNEAPNPYVGIWHDGNHLEFWNTLVREPIKVAKYHTLLMDNENQSEKVELYRAIKESPMKKIYVCNPLMVRAKGLLNIDDMVHVPFNNWFDTQFDEMVRTVSGYIVPDEPCIVMTSAGMGAKVLVAELTKRYPRNIYLDVGSGLDKICTKKTSRGWEPRYVDLMTDLRELLPEDWESETYHWIFEDAKTKLGVHAHWLCMMD